LHGSQIQDPILISGYNFQVPGNLKGFDGKPMKPDQFIALTRNIVSILFDAQQL
jgi:hypothetical protein